MTDMVFNFVEVQNRGGSDERVVLTLGKLGWQLGFGQNWMWGGVGRFEGVPTKHISL
jgi:hypothetical protein